MIRRTAVALSLGIITFAGAFVSGPVAHANSYADCTGNPSACTGGATCRTLPKSARTGVSTDTGTIGVCLLDTEYQAVLQGLAAKSTQTGVAGSPATTQTGVAGNSSTGETIANPLKYNDLESLLQGVLKSLITIGSILLTLALVWVGFKFVAARGNEEKIRSARTALMWTVIGGLILLGATAIESVISTTVHSISA